MPTTPEGLWPALIAARSEIGAFTKTEDNPFYKSKFVPLHEIIREVTPVLAKHGLYAYGYSVAGMPGDSAAYLVKDNKNADAVIELARGAFVTRIVHAESGQFIEDVRPFVGVESRDDMGGHASFSFRYGLSSLLSLELKDMNDDGTGKNAEPRGAQGSAPATPQRPATATGGQSPAPRSNPPRKQAAGNVVRRGADCLHCGERGSVSEVKSGQNAGMWMCKPWEEKGWPGCWAKYSSDPSKWSAEELTAYLVANGLAEGQGENDHDETEGGSDPLDDPDKLPF